MNISYHQGSKRPIQQEASKGRLTKRLTQPKRLHPILPLHRHLPHIQNTRKPARLDPTMLVERLEDGPALFAVDRVAGETEGEEEGLDCFWAKDVSGVD